MIYKIKLDGTDIYGTSPDLSLVSPSVKIEVNAAGSLEFTMPSRHLKYNDLNVLTSTLEVYENDDLIWFGRILDVKKNLKLDKEVVCEGPLSFFNDSVQRPYVYESDVTTVHSFFESVIANHNTQVPENRRFTVGEITVPNIYIYRKTNYETTKDVLETMCLNAEGGYFIFRREEGINYIDWLADFEEENIQPVEFGLNLVDISQKIAGEDIKTAILPLGKEIDGERITISEVNEGHDYLDSEAVSTYGRIIKVVEFDDIGVPSELLAAAQKWLANQTMEPLTIDCSAAELNYIDSSYPAFRVGQKAHVKSDPHVIDTILPLVSIDIKLDSAVKKVTIGTQERKDLTEIYKEND